MVSKHLSDIHHQVLLFRSELLHVVWPLLCHVWLFFKWPFLLLIMDVNTVFDHWLVCDSFWIMSRETLHYLRYYVQSITQIKKKICLSNIKCQWWAEYNLAEQCIWVLPKTWKERFCHFARYMIINHIIQHTSVLSLCLKYAIVK